MNLEGNDSRQEQSDAVILAAVKETSEKFH